MRLAELDAARCLQGVPISREQVAELDSALQMALKFFTDRVGGVTSVRDSEAIVYSRMTTTHVHTRIGVSAPNSF